MINYESATGPFSHSENTSVRIMYTVLLTLVPAVIFGVYQFGLNSLYALLLTPVVAVLSEYFCLKVMGRNARACLDGSAMLTGVLLAMSLPPTVPLWLCAFGGVFAIVVGKQIYGGLGQNLFNPAMLARVMLLICFPVEMTNWSVPAPIDFSHNQVLVPDAWFRFDGVTSATSLSGIVDESTQLFSLFIGAHSGSLGETSALLILLGGLYLIYKGIIHWAIPVAFLMGLGLPAAISSWVSPEQFLPATTHLFSGAAMLGAFYIATDLVTSPTSVKGQLLYGASCGVLIWLIRSFGSYPEGVAFAVLIMNAASPLIDHYLRPDIFGSRSVVEK
ncbi:RnfABCDGE type electron transport complex subunit D [Vibrio sp. HA2012]|uniref:RnfABCDGE type electron transport complex subunit D n=1 Tax=Vibrio sp. HA2012 TaxID=1971595 RepID=UPI000C2B7B91|nr:RnfABCDGE type electron transport complex subunit D [Vibrio sp. HA2012]PJC87625.1 RnfABCDGE type electron transport complex subunit D [Vibrio sp. HA2012]